VYGPDPIQAAEAGRHPPDLPVSVPSATSHTPAATADADPLDEPPGVRRVSNGLRVLAGSPPPRHTVTVLPTSTAPPITKASDGSQAPGTIARGANDSSGDPNFFLFGSHIYDVAGQYHYTVSVSEPYTGPLSSSGTAIVSGPPLLAKSAPISGTQGVALPADTVVATFRDSSPVPDPAAFAARLNRLVLQGVA